MSVLYRVPLIVGADLLAMWDCDSALRLHQGRPDVTLTGLIRKM